MSKGHIVHAYVRASTDQQTTEQQENAIREHYPEGTPMIFYTESESGWKGRRSEYDSLRDAILKGKVREVCACNVARLGRNQREALQLLEICQDANVRIVLLDHALDFNGPLGTALFALLSALAQMDSDTKSANIKRKFAWKREQEPDWKMHGNIRDTVSKKLKFKSPEVYAMKDKGKTAKYIAEQLGLSQHSVGKLLKLRGKVLMTRQDYAAAFPGWHLLPIEDRPEIPDLKAM